MKIVLSPLFVCYLIFLPSTYIGALVFASIDQVPDELIDNAVILGVLSFLVAFLFIIDMSEKMETKGKTDSTQTDTSSIDRHFIKSQNIGTVSSELNLIEHDENDRRNSRNQSVRSKSSSHPNVQGNDNTETFISDVDNQTQPNSFNKFHVHLPTSSQEGSIDNHEIISSDIVRAKTYPSIQTPTKVKHYPTIVNHFESEPYRKIFNRPTQQQSSYSRYHDQTKTHGSANDSSTFYDDFSKYRQDSYYQGPKVDQLMVIRDYSNEQHTCSCHEGDIPDNMTIKSGYVSQVAKLWDDRSKNQESLSFTPKNTSV